MVRLMQEPLLIIYAALVRRKLLIITIISLTLVLLAFDVNLKLLIVFPMLLAAASLSTIYKRVLRVPPAFELISLTTVAVGMTQGAWAGAIFGATAALAAEIINGSVDVFIFGYVAGRAVMGALAAVLAAVAPQLGIIAVGMILTVIFNAMAQSLYLLQGDAEALFKTAAYVAVNLLVNLLIFSAFGNLLVGLLG